MATMVEKGVEGEIQHGKALADVAKEFNIAHYVYSSMQSANKKTGLPFFEGKAQIESHILNLGLPATVIRPVFFMENYLNYKNIEELRAGRFGSALTNDRKLQMIAVKDLAAFVVLVIENRERFLGKDIDIAGDELTQDQIAVGFSTALDLPITYYQESSDTYAEMGDEYLDMLQWYQRDGYSVNIKQLHKNYPEIAWHSFENWLSEIDWNQMTVTPDQ
jgi:uncharacterized protein YbjT (DUF2867 family)